MSTWPIVRTFKLPEITRLNAMLVLSHVQQVLAAFGSHRVILVPAMVQFACG